MSLDHACEIPPAAFAVAHTIITLQLLLFASRISSFFPQSQSKIRSYKNTSDSSIASFFGIKPKKFSFFTINSKYLL